jgi:hypothetical protein
MSGFVENYNALVISWDAAFEQHSLLTQQVCRRHSSYRFRSHYRDDSWDSATVFKKVIAAIRFAIRVYAIKRRA